MSSKAPGSAAELGFRVCLVISFGMQELRHFGVWYLGCLEGLGLGTLLVAGAFKIFPGVLCFGPTRRSTGSSAASESASWQGLSVAESLCHVLQSFPLAQHSPMVPGRNSMINPHKFSCINLLSVCLYIY